MRDQVPHPYITVGEIVLCILMLCLRDDDRFCTEW